MQPSPPPSSPLTPNRKALIVNLDEARYGTLAEIGAGQEVARYFFQAGGASGTVAKTMSAYDMQFSDAIYGKAPRYVSRERLLRMLDHEYALLLDRLQSSRGARTCFFVFADTVATRNFQGTNECHGWMGLRFQMAPGGPPHDFLLHVRMLDTSALQQQAALGLCGLNLIYGAFYLLPDFPAFLDSLRDHLEPERLEVDMLECQGPAFDAFDPRHTSLQLLTRGYTSAVLFGPSRQVLQPSEFLRKKALLVQRGGFRPVTHVNLDMLAGARADFCPALSLDPAAIQPLFEITLRNLRRTQGSGLLDHVDLFQRVDCLNALGFSVLISDYFEHYRLSAYFRRYTAEPIGLVLGLTTLLEIFHQPYYDHLEGGILEAFGRLFQHRVHLLLYPMLRENLLRWCRDRPDSHPALADPAFLQELSAASFPLLDASTLRVRDHLRNLYKYLLENRFLLPVTTFNPAVLPPFPRDILALLRAGDPAWRQWVPEPAATLIQEGHFFRPSPAPSVAPSFPASP